MENHTFFILASGYWLSDYMKDYEIRLKGYFKQACITEKNTLWSFTIGQCKTQTADWRLQTADQG